MPRDAILRFSCGRSVTVSPPDSSFPLSHVLACSTRLQARPSLASLPPSSAEDGRPRHHDHQSGSSSSSSSSSLSLSLRCSWYHFCRGVQPAQLTAGGVGAMVALGCRQRRGEERRKQRGKQGVRRPSTAPTPRLRHSKPVSARQVHVIRSRNVYE